MSSRTTSDGAPALVSPSSSYRGLVARVVQLQTGPLSSRHAVVDALADSLRSALLRGGFDFPSVDDAGALTEALAELHARLHDGAVRDRAVAAFIAVFAGLGTVFVRDALEGGWRWVMFTILALLALSAAGWVPSIERRLAAIDRLRAVLGDVQRAVLGRAHTRVRIVTDGDKSDAVADSAEAVSAQPKRGEGGT